MITPVSENDFDPRSVEITAELDREQRQLVLDDLREQFRFAYGKGLQRDLAAQLDVAESTLSTWFSHKTDAPLTALMAMRQILEQRKPPQIESDWIAIRADGKYQVVERTGIVGRVICQNISTAREALLIAAAPLMRDFVLELVDQGPVLVSLDWIGDGDVYWLWEAAIKALPGLEEEVGMPDGNSDHTQHDVSEGDS